MTGKLPHYDGWRRVPEHLKTATWLSALEFPLTPGDPAATVTGSDWRGRRDTFYLYDTRTARPNRTSPRRLEQAYASASATRVCGGCGGHPLAPLDPANPLCLACRHIAAIRHNQERFAEQRRNAARRIARLLAVDGAAVAHIRVHIPPPTPGGATRKPTAAQFCATDAATGKDILNVFMRIVGERSKFVPEDAISPDLAVPQIHDALAGRTLLFWHDGEGHPLQEYAGHPSWARPKADTPYSERVRPPWHSVSDASRVWRADLDPRGEQSASVTSYFPDLHPGTPARLLLLLRRIAATAEPEDIGQPE